MLQLVKVFILILDVSKKNEPDSHRNCCASCFPAISYTFWGTDLVRSEHFTERLVTHSQKIDHISKFVPGKGNSLGIYV
jgi:hypothetical protein